jgi:hypothetical protein
MATLAGQRKETPRHWAGAVLLAGLNVVAASVVVVGILVGWSQIAVPLTDWESYRAASERLLAGEPLYPPEHVAAPFGMWDAARGQGYVYPPPAAVIMTPFVWFWPVWIALNAVAVIAGLLAIIWRNGRLTTYAVAGVCWLLAVSPWFWQALFNGQVTGILVLVLAVAPSLASGAGAIIKLFPIVWVASVRDAVTAAAVFGGIALVTLPIVGLGSWSDFVAVTLNARPECHEPSLVCAGVPSVVGYALGAGLALLGARLAGARRLWCWGLVPIVAAPDLPWHYLLFLYPALVTTLFTARPERGGRGQAIPRPSRPGCWRSSRPSLRCTGDRHGEARRGLPQLRGGGPRPEGQGTVRQVSATVVGPLRVVVTR